jgi:molecular chaperone GrpE
LKLALIDPYYRHINEVLEHKDEAMTASNATPEEQPNQQDNSVEEATEQATTPPEETGSLVNEEMRQAVKAALGEQAEEEGAAAVPEEPQRDWEGELAKMKEQWIRAVAENDNLRKRSERDLQEARKYSVTAIARDMVNVSENLQLAIQNIPAEARQQDQQLENLAKGVEMTYEELLRIFGQHGITRIDPKGEKFNHNFHQAVAQIEEPTVEPGCIVQVLQAGYVIHDRLLRPAMVTVAKAGNPADSVNTQA